MHRLPIFRALVRSFPSLILIAALGWHLDRIASGPTCQSWTTFAGKHHVP